MKIKHLLITSLLIFIFLVESKATHVIGGSLTYEQLPGAANGFTRYKIYLKLWRDCSKPTNVNLPGQGGAALPRITIRDVNGNIVNGVDTRGLNLERPIVAVPQSVDSCTFLPNNVCVQEGYYSRTIDLIDVAGGYNLMFALCCRNSSILNISNPLGTSSTFYARIPGKEIAIQNNDPVFSEYPPIFVCKGVDVNYDHSAIDTDGDSLVYSLYQPYDGAVNGGSPNLPSYPASGPADQPLPGSILPQFVPVNYAPGFGVNNPLGGANITINPSTGLLTGIPQNVGQYVVGVRVREYRNGVFLGQTNRDFQFNVLVCPQPTVATLGLSDVCSGLTVAFNNQTSINSTSYSWYFGDPTTDADSSNLRNPFWTYPSVGTYTVKLIAQKETKCSSVDSIPINISWVKAKLGNPTKICVNNPVIFTDSSTVSSNAIIISALWDFRDGSPLSSSPIHSYTTAGTYRVKLTVTNNFGCVDTFSKSVIIIQQQPTSNAGLDLPICRNNIAITLNGSITVASGGKWTGGSGSFLPNDSTLNAKYIPTAAEITAGSVVLNLATYGNGVCLAANDNVVINFTNPPIVNAGLDTGVCKNNANFALSGTFLGSTSAIWKTLGTGKFLSTNKDSSALMTDTYSLSNADKTSGSVRLILTSRGNGGCKGISDTMRIRVTNSPKVNAGIDIVTCKNTSRVSVSGTVTGALGGRWTTLGSGIFLSSNNNISNILTDTYIPSITDLNNNSVRLVLTSTDNGGCLEVSDTMFISYTPGPTVNVGVDKFICANNATISLSGTINNIATGGVWYGGEGIYSPDSTSLNITYTLSANEISSGLAALVLKTTGNLGGCSPSFDTLFISVTALPKVNAGIDKSACKNNPNVSVTAVTSLSPVFGWTTMGTGKFLSTNIGTTGLLTDTYIPSATDLSNGSVKLVATGNRSTCNAVSDTMKIVYSPIPIINAGPDKIKCENNTVITLNGSVIGALGGVWSNGNGTFDPISGNTLNTKYTPTLAESVSGNVLKLILTSTDNGACLAVKDSIKITFTPKPISNPGTTKNVCANKPTVQLNGSVVRATGGIWSGGTGTYNVSNTDTTVKYIPSPAEIAAGSVTLTLTTTGNFDCNAVSSNVLINIGASPTVNAGIDKSACADNALINIIGSSSTGTAVWSGGNGDFGNVNSLTTTYTASSTEIINGFVNLYLTTLNNGLCNAVRDTMKMTIIPSPIVDAGSNQNICKLTSGIILNGSVLNAGGGRWTYNGSGGTFTPSDTSLNATFTPSTLDKTKASLTLTLTSRKNGSCVEVTDQMSIIFQNSPTANAGPNQTICTKDFPVQLAGSGSAGQWIGGAGLFSPNDITLNAKYTPSNSEIALGTVNLTWKTNATGSCPSVTDVMKLTIKPSPTINTGLDQIICGNVKTINIAAVKTIASGIIWKTTGSGSFQSTGSSSSTTANDVYKVSASDITSGTVYIIATTTGNGFCNPVSDSIKLTITPSILINAGVNKIICADKSSISLTGSVGVASGAQWTILNGTGVFASNNLSTSSLLTDTYQITNADKTAKIVKLLLTTTGNGSCQAQRDTVTFNITPAPTITVTPKIAGICADSSYFIMSAVKTVAAGIVWSTTGTGIFTPNKDTTFTKYIPSASDRMGTTLVFIASTTGSGTCNEVGDTVKVTINPQPTVNTGADTSVCADNIGVKLNSIAITGATGVSWTTSGTGRFASTNTGIGNILKDTYILSALDRSNGIVTLTASATGIGLCKPVNDKIIITVTPAPTVDAGFDKLVCADVSTLNVSGSVSVATGGTWSSLTPLANRGAFANANNLTTTYTPTATEKALGFVNLVLSTSGNGNCLVKMDTVKFTLQAVPNITPLSNIIVCEDSTTIKLTGLSNTNKGKWSTSGTGVFAPNADTLNNTYSLSVADKLAGLVTIKLSSENNGVCIANSKTFTITITKAPVANQGSDTIVCADAISIPLKGIITIASGGSWSSSGTGKFVSTNTSIGNQIIDSYIPSIADKNAGSVILKLKTTGNGSCQSVVSAAKTITITKAPVVSAGNNITICKDAASVSLSNASVLNATGGKWTTSGTGNFFPDNQTIGAQYFPSLLDKSKDSVLITLTSTGNGLCNPVSSTIKLKFTPIPTIDAGIDKTVCADTAGVPFSAIFTVAQNVQWTSTGSGTFYVKPDSNNVVYVPSLLDISAGNVKLYVSTTGNGTCKSVKDSTNLIITPAPTVNAGSDTSYCADFDKLIRIKSTFTVAKGVKWSISGNGILQPYDTTAAGIYYATATDIANGKVVFEAITRGNGQCKAVKSTKIALITKTPTVNAGVDQSFCGTKSTINLKAITTVASGGVWNTNGAGFLINDTSKTATYNVGGSDVVEGLVVFSFTSTGNGKCKAVTDTMILRLQNPPKINAGIDQTICADTNGVLIKGTLENATGLNWSARNSNGTATGLISPSVSDTTIMYKPSLQDIAAGIVILKIKSLPTGLCPVTADSMILTINPTPILNVVALGDLCANAPSISLSSSIVNAGGVKWSSSAGTFSPSATVLNPIFTPTNSQIINGSVVLTVTSTGNGLCKSISKNQSVNITPAPTVNAGQDIQVCNNISSVNINGSVTVASGGIWSKISATVGGTFNSASSLITTYNPSLADKALGSVMLKLTSTGFGLGNGICQNVSDTILISFISNPTINAGSDQTVCTNSYPVKLKGNGTVAKWTIVSGSMLGKFVSTNADTSRQLNDQFIPSKADSIAGSVTLRLTSIDNSGCPVLAPDDVTIFITPGSQVYAGVSQLICANNPNVAVVGTIKRSAGAKWSTNGNGVFASTNISTSTSLSDTYLPSTSDIVSGKVILTLTTINDTCASANDTMTIKFTLKPIVNAGLDKTICISTPNVPILGSVSIATGGIWSTLGTGKFGSTNNSTSFTLSDSYLPSSADTIAGKVKLVLASTGIGNCSVERDTILIKFTNGPKINPGVYAPICADAGLINLTANVTVATGVVWSSSGSGKFLPDSFSLKTTYVLSKTDSSSLTPITFTAISTGNGTCLAKSNFTIVNVTPAPMIDAGLDKQVCQDTAFFPIIGSKNGVVTAVTWTENGFGSIVAPNSLSSVYNLNPSDFTSQPLLFTLKSTAQGTCKSVSDQMSVSITPKPTVNAGIDQIICKDETSISISGQKTGSTGATWSTTGTGTFTSSNLATSTLLADSYKPSLGDKTSGSVKLILTSTGFGNCKPAKDTLLIKFSPKPTVNAGNDRIVCADSNYINLTGNYTVAKSAIWSTSGSGYFSPNVFDKNAKYILSNSDKQTTLVNLFLTTLDNGRCFSYSDTLRLIINQKPTISAGNDTLVCQDIPNIVLNGSKTIATGVRWRSMSNIPGTFNNNGFDKPTYTPSATERLAGSVNFEIASIGNGLCDTIKDYMTLTFSPSPKVTVNAGQDQITCATSGNIQLNGTVVNATGGSWKTTGSGSFLPDSNSLNPIYIPSLADVAGTNSGNNTSIIFTLRARGVANVCQNVIYSSNMKLTFTPAPTITGSDTTVCADITIGVSRKVAINNIPSGVIWSSSGTGSISPNTTSRNILYNPSTSDRNNGSVTLTATTTGNGSCASKSITKTIFITKSPTIDAGLDKIVCENQSSITLKALVTNALKGRWTSSGSPGTFSPKPDTLTVNYNPTAADIAATKVNLKITSEGNGNCKAVTDNLLISFAKIPIVDAGQDVQICSDNNQVNLKGVIKNTISATWSTSGTGTFSPNNSVLNATYKPSLADSKLSFVTLTLTSQSGAICDPVSDQVKILFRPKPVVNITSQPLCILTQGALLGANIQNASTVKWSSAGTGVFSPSEFAFNTQYYPSSADILAGNVSIKLVAGGTGVCATDSAITQLILKAGPIAQAGSDLQVCSGSVASLTSSPLNDVSYSWFNRTPTNFANSISTTANILNDTSFVLRVTDNRGCTGFDTVYVQAVKPPVFGFSSALYCFNDTLVIDANPTPAPLIGNYQWFRNDTLLYTNTKTVIQPQRSGLYKLSYILGNCTKFSTLINVVNPPKISATDTTICKGNSVLLKATSDQINTSFIWTFNNDIKSITNSYLADTVSASKRYYLVKGTDTRGCISFDSAKVKTVPLPILTLSKIPACIGQEIALSAKPINIVDTTDNQYKWNTVGGQIPTGTDQLSTIYVKKSGKYSVIFNIGGCYAYDTSEVDFSPLPRPDIKRYIENCFDSVNNKFGKATTISVQQSNLTYTYKWITNTADSLNPKRTVNTSGIYYVNIINQNNCKTLDSVVVVPVCDPYIDVPNVFTPDGNTGDNRDKTFRAFGPRNDIDNFKMLVFNRWGQIIFVSDDIALGWDGTFKGESMPAGVYPYVITYEGSSPQRKGLQKSTGKVTLLK